MCQKSSVWSANESGDHLCFPSFHHIIARLFGCFEHIAKGALPQANCCPALSIIPSHPRFFDSVRV